MIKRILLTIPAELGKEKPVLVRYGWEPYTTANLYNGAGLPASTFRGTIGR